MASDEVDPFFETRGQLLVGNYQAAVSAASQLPKCVERDFLLYRAYAQSDPNVVLRELARASEPELQAVRLYAQYLTQDSAAAVAEAKAMLQDIRVGQIPQVRLMIATIYTRESMWDEVLRALHGSAFVEARALMVQAYLTIHQLELAQKELAAMQKTDDDHVLTAIASVQVLIAMGPTRMSEAIEILGELEDRWTATPFLSCLQAACHIVMGEFGMAESSLHKALERDARNADVLADLIVVSQHLNRPAQVIERYEAQLRALAPSHVYVRHMDAALQQLAAAAARFAPRVAA